MRKDDLKTENSGGVAIPKTESSSSQKTENSGGAALPKTETPPSSSQKIENSGGAATPKTETPISSPQKTEGAEIVAIIKTETPVSSSPQKTENTEIVATPPSSSPTTESVVESAKQTDVKVLPTRPVAPRAPSVPAFDCEYYVMSNPDLRDKFFRHQDHKLICDQAFEHWLQHGHETHKDKNIPAPGFYPDFDCLEYLHRYPDNLKPYFLMNDRKHFDCTSLKMWYDYVGKYQNNIATYVP